MNDKLVKIRNTGEEPLHLSVLGRDVDPGETVEVQGWVAKKVHEITDVPWKIVKR